MNMSAREGSTMNDGVRSHPIRVSRSVFRELAQIKEERGCSWSEAADVCFQQRENEIQALRDQLGDLQSEAKKIEPLKKRVKKLEDTLG